MRVSRWLVLGALLLGRFSISGSAADSVALLTRYFETNGPTGSQELRSLLAETKADLNMACQFLKAGRFPSHAIRLIDLSLKPGEVLTPELCNLIADSLKASPQHTGVQYYATRIILERQPAEDALEFLASEVMNWFDRGSERAVFEAVRWLATTGKLHQSSEVRQRAGGLLKQLLELLREAAAKGRAHFWDGLLTKGSESAFSEPEMAILLADYLITLLAHLEQYPDGAQHAALGALLSLPNLPPGKLESAWAAEIVRGPDERTKIWLWHLHRQKSWFAGNPAAQSAVSNALQRLPEWTDFARALKQGQISDAEGYWKPWFTLRKRTGVSP